MKHSIDSQAKTIGILVPGALLLAGCTIDLAPQPVLPTETAVKTAAARPLESGLLAVSPSGTFALASDDVGGAVYVIALSADQLTSTKVALGAGEEPGRAALTDTHAYVTLPRSGGIAVVDLAGATVVDHMEPCPSPQSAAVEGESLHVACRGGDLVTLGLADGAVQRALSLDEDLRDVVVVPSGLVVSRFVKAELLWLDAAGAVIDRSVPEVNSGNEAAVAWRTFLASDGRVLVAHQTDSDQNLGGGYSGGECGSIAAPTVTGFAPPGVSLPSFPNPEEEALSAKAQKVSQMSVLSGAGAFDVTVANGQMTFVFPGNEFANRFAGVNTGAGGATSGSAPSAFVDTHPIHTFAVGVDDLDCQFGSSTPEEDPAVPVAIASASSGPLSGQALILTHSPATVRVRGTSLSVQLHEDDRRSTGLELFQMTVGTGISCSSCHPGGRADARTWQLARGPRRTQPLEGGVSQLGAFHWDAEFSNFSDLLDDVMTSRMGLGQNLSEERKAALLSFVDAIPKAPVQAAADTEAAARGRALFESDATACTGCHTGPAFTNNEAFDVGTGGVFVTPSLVGVGYREPLMHDGCASDLTDRFGPCGGGDEHGKVSQLTDPEIADLVAYMKTL